MYSLTFKFIFLEIFLCIYILKWKWNFIIHTIPYQHFDLTIKMLFIYFHVQNSPRISLCFLMVTWDSVGPPVIYVSNFLLMNIEVFLIFDIKRKRNWDGYISANIFTHLLITHLGCILWNGVSGQRYNVNILIDVAKLLPIA